MAHIQALWDDGAPQQPQGFRDWGDAVTEEVDNATAALTASARRLVRDSGTQSLPHGASTTLTYTTTVDDEGGITHSAGVLTIPSGGGGRYALSAGVALANSSPAGSGRFALLLRVNTVNVAQIQVRANQDDDPKLSVATTMLLTEGTTVQARVENIQNSGSSAVTAVASAQQTFLAIARIAAV